MMPVLSYHFSLSPDDIWGLTNAEYETYRAAAEKIVADETSQ